MQEIESRQRSHGRRAERARGLMGLVCWLGLLAFVAFAGLARGADEVGSGSAIVAQPYRGGPLAVQEAQPTLPDLPTGARELFGLSVLGLVLYGLRASGLSRQSERS